MAIQIIECAQNSPEWAQERLGLCTASEYATVQAKGRGGAPSKTRATYLRKLAGERITGEPMDNYSNAHIARGHEMESEARDAYALIHDADPNLVGFIRNGDTGASPDALLGDNALLEIKTALPHRLIEYIEADQFPPEHMAQCQGQLWVAERESVDLVVYWPKMPLFVKRLYRDEKYIAKLADAVRVFNEELEALVEKVRGYGQG